MYDREALLNQMFVDYINTLAASVTQENLHTRPVESGHTPLWILGHVAICAELGIKMLGGEIEHLAGAAGVSTNGEAAGSVDAQRSSLGGGVVVGTDV